MRRSSAKSSTQLATFLNRIASRVRQAQDVRNAAAAAFLGNEAP